MKIIENFARQNTPWIILRSSWWTQKVKEEGESENKLEPDREASTQKGETPIERIECCCAPKRKGEAEPEQSRAIDKQQQEIVWVALQRKFWFGPWLDLEDISDIVVFVIVLWWRYYYYFLVAPAALSLYIDRPSDGWSQELFIYIKRARWHCVTKFHPFFAGDILPHFHRKDRKATTSVPAVCSWVKFCLAPALCVAQLVTDQYPCHCCGHLVASVHWSAAPHRTVKWFSIYKFVLVKRPFNRHRRHKILTPNGCFVSSSNVHPREWPFDLIIILLCLIFGGC